MVHYPNISVLVQDYFGTIFLFFWDPNPPTSIVISLFLNFAKPLTSVHYGYNEYTLKSRYKIVLLQYFYNTNT